MTRYAPLAPNRRNADPEPAYLVAGRGRLQVWTEHGCEIAHTTEQARTLIRKLNKHAVYASGSLRAIRTATGPDGWTLCKWGPMIAWQKLGGTTVYSSRDIFASLTDDQPGRAIFFLCEIRLQLNKHGAGLGGWGSMALQLWRATLDKPIAFSSQTMRDGLYGPRKQVQDVARGVTLTDTRYVDLRSAYPTAMISEAMPTRLRRSSGKHIDGVGIALATVTIPPPARTSSLVHWGPLPVRRHRVTSWTKPGEHFTWWTFRELRLAQDAGLAVELDQCWEGIRHTDPFMGWWDIVRPLRREPGPVGRFFKVVSNSLWGIFAVGQHVPMLITLGASGRPLEMTRLDRRPPLPTAAYVAAEISGRVRDRVYREVLNEHALYVDTDGAIITGNAPLPVGCSDHATDGQWRVAYSMKQCQIKAAQAYRWTGYDDRTRYVVAGIRDADERTFRNLPDADFLINV